MICLEEITFRKQGEEKINLHKNVESLMKECERLWTDYLCVCDE